MKFVAEVEEYEPANYETIKHWTFSLVAKLLKQVMDDEDDATIDAALCAPETAMNGISEGVNGF